jgi:hypothetical protein
VTASKFWHSAILSRSLRAPVATAARYGWVFDQLGAQLASSRTASRISGGTGGGKKIAHAAARANQLGKLASNGLLIHVFIHLDLPQ